jgi:hypothetical protein
MDLGLTPNLPQVSPWRVTTIVTIRLILDIEYKDTAWHESVSPTISCPDLGSYEDALTAWAIAPRDVNAATVHEPARIISYYGNLIIDPICSFNGSIEGWQGCQAGRRHTMVDSHWRAEVVRASLLRHC